MSLVVMNHVQLQHVSVVLNFTFFNMYVVAPKILLALLACALVCPGNVSCGLDKGSVVLNVVLSIFHLPTTCNMQQLLLLHLTSDNIICFPSHWVNGARVLSVVAGAGQVALPTQIMLLTTDLDCSSVCAGSSSMRTRKFMLSKQVRQSSPQC